MGFKKGQSGNPAGRPKGVSPHAKLRDAIRKDIPEIIEAMVKRAKEGDTAAAKILLDRALPALKPAEPPITFPVRDGLSATGRAILQQMGAAELTPEEGTKLIGALAGLARVVEVDDLTRRLEALEARQNRTAAKPIEHAAQRTLDLSEPKP
jgi:hypothetical protein